jgi:hypothetical protein
MDQNDKASNDKITRLENEIKVLKNEVQAVLLDLRESYLNMENPFNSDAGPAAVQPIVITERTSNSRPQPEPAAAASHKPEPGKSEVKPAPENPVAFAPEETSRREIQTAANSNPGFRSTLGKATDIPNRRNDKLDILMVAGLVSWVEDSTEKLGKERSLSVLEMSQVMGYLSGEIKPIMVKLIELTPESTVELSSRTKTYLESLMKLNRLLSQDKLDEIALELLSMGSEEKKHG